LVAVKITRKTSNPEFNEEFAFNAKFTDLASRTLHFTVFSFDRFSRQKTIGVALVSNLVEQFEYAWESECCRDVTPIEQVRLRIHGSVRPI
jgi:Ca2+-dependent lipid-binding protein